MSKNDKKDSKFMYEINKSTLEDEDDLNDLLSESEEFFKRLKVTDRVIKDVELPIYGFDIKSSLSQNITDFGATATYVGIGEYVRYIGTAQIQSNGVNIDMTGMVGQIVLRANDRVVIMTEKGYFGWLDPEEFVHIETISISECKLIN